MKSNNLYTDKIFLIILLLILLLLSLFLMNEKRSWNGDEIITYSMANNQDGGFVFSNGKVGKYYDEYIYSESFAKMSKNVINTVCDVITNGRNAAYFRMEPPRESGWFSKAEINKIFQVEDGTRFDFINVYKNSMSDESHSFLYYMSIHLISSLFKEGNSDSKWCAYIFNLLMICILMFFSSKTAVLLGVSHKPAAFFGFIGGLCHTFLSMLTVERDYVFCSAGVIVQSYLLLSLLKSEAKDRKRWFICIFLVNITGFWFAYLMTVYTISLFLVWLIIILKNRTDFRFLRDFILVYIFSGITALAVWPVSVFGCLSKLSNDIQNGEEKSFIQIVMRSIQELCLFYTDGKIIFGVLLFLILIIFTFVLLNTNGFGIQMEWFYLIIASLIAALFTGCLMGSFYVGRIASAFIFSICGIIYDVIKAGKKKWMSIAVISVSFLASALNINSATQSIRSDNSMFERYYQISEQYENMPVMYIRSYKGNYLMTRFLGKASEVLVVTLPNSSLNDYLQDEKLVNSDEILVYVDNNEKIRLDTDTFLNAMGFSKITDLCKGTICENGDMRLLSAKRIG